MRYAARSLDALNDRENNVKFYLVEYDHEKGTVSVKPKFTPKEGLSMYGERELENSSIGENSRSTVLIEADKVEDLKNAYPNYFGDVQYFNKNLQLITQGQEAREYTMPPKYAAPRPPQEPTDLTWLRPGRQQKAPTLRSPSVEATNQTAEGMGRDPHAASDSLDDYMALEEAFLPSGKGQGGGQNTDALGGTEGALATGTDVTPGTGADLGGGDETQTETGLKSEREWDQAKAREKETAGQLEEAEKNIEIS